MLFLRPACVAFPGLIFGDAAATMCEQAKDEASGRDYYYNAKTGVTQWEVLYGCRYRMLSTSVC